MNPIPGTRLATFGKKPWAGPIIGALLGAVCTVVAESLTMRDERGFFISHKGLIIGAAIGLVLALFFSTNLAVLQMPSVDGQAITSVSLGIMAGATVGFLGAVGGIVLGFVLRRSVLAHRILTPACSLTPQLHI